MKIGSIIKSVKKRWWRDYEELAGKVTLSPEELKEIRKSYNLSQRCFAELVDISVDTLQNYEIGHRKMPGPSRSLFLFARDNRELLMQKYLKIVSKPKEFRA